MNSGSSSASSDSCRYAACDTSPSNSNCTQLGDILIQQIDEKQLQSPQQQSISEDKKGRRSLSNAENENNIAAELIKSNAIGAVGQLKPCKSSTVMLNISSQTKEGAQQSQMEQDKSLDNGDQDQSQTRQRKLSQSKLQSALQERSLNMSVPSCLVQSEKGSFQGDQQGKDCKVEGSEYQLQQVDSTESKDSSQLQMEKQLNELIFQDEEDVNIKNNPTDDGKIVVGNPLVNIVPLESKNEEKMNVQNNYPDNNESNLQISVACPTKELQSQVDQFVQSKIIIDSIEDGVESRQKDLKIQIFNPNQQIKEEKQRDNVEFKEQLDNLEVQNEPLRENPINVLHQIDKELAQDNLMKNKVSQENQKDETTQDTQELKRQINEGEMNQSLNSSPELNGVSSSILESTVINCKTLNQQLESEISKTLKTELINEKHEDLIDLNIHQQNSVQDCNQSAERKNHLSSEILSNSEETVMEESESKISQTANTIGDQKLPLITTVENEVKPQDNIDNIVDIPKDIPTNNTQDETAVDTALNSRIEVSQEISKESNIGSDHYVENYIKQIDSTIQENTENSRLINQSESNEEIATEMDWQFVEGIDELIEEISGQLQNEGYVCVQKNNDNITITSEEEEIIEKIIKDVEDEEQIQTKEKYQHDIQEREASMDYLLECVKIISEAERDLESLQKCMLKEQQTLKDIQAFARKQIGSEGREELEKEKQNRLLEQQQTGKYRNDERQQVPQTNQQGSKVKNTQQKQPQPQNVNVRDILAVSLENIRFGVVFPGNIFEDAVEISNKSKETIFLKAVGLCLNQEFDSHGEYVYSIRKTTNYDYNEKLTIQVSPQSTVKIHVALKVPNIHAATIIKGSFAVTITGYDTYISIPITAQVEIPKVVCTRQLFHSQSEHKIIRLAIRKSKKSDCKIPFKNVSNHQIQIEPIWLDDQQMVQLISSSTGLLSKEKQPSPFNLILQPALFTVPPKGFFMMQCILKPSNAYKEFIEKRAQENDKSALLIKNVLLMKIVNSSIILHFPLSLEIAL